MAGRVNRSAFRGCSVHQGQLNVPAGTQLRRQNVRLPAQAGGGQGHVYYHAGTSQWFTVKSAGASAWTVCVFVGGTCPCDG